MNYKLILFLFFIAIGLSSISLASPNNEQKKSNPIVPIEECVFIQSIWVLYSALFGFIIGDFLGHEFKYLKSDSKAIGQLIILLSLNGLNIMNPTNGFKAMNFFVSSLTLGCGLRYHGQHNLVIHWR